LIPLTRLALQNAASIVSLILTTEVLIAEHKGEEKTATAGAMPEEWEAPTKSCSKPETVEVLVVDHQRHPASHGREPAINRGL
jgi:hypothetical protein